jgi:hypothetical protein
MPDTGQEYTNSVNQGKPGAITLVSTPYGSTKKREATERKEVDTFGVRPRRFLAKAWSRHVAFVTAGVRFSRVAPDRDRENVRCGFSIANPANKVKY